MIASQKSCSAARVLVTLCGFQALGQAAANGNVVMSGSSEERLLQTTVGATALGCYTDGNDRRLPTKIYSGSLNTPEYCQGLCLAAGQYLYSGVQWGQECWCGRAGIEYDTLGTSDVCTKACSGDSSTTCGGYYAFDLYQLDAVEQPAGHLGCYGDSSSDRVFSHKYKSSSMTPEVCKAYCQATSSDYVYYGTQYSSECFCGEASSVITKHGESEACGYRCAGDNTAICGGFNAMNVFSLADGVTPAPVTPAPVTPAPVTPAPVTPAPVTPAPVTPAPVTPAPSTAAPATPSTGDVLVDLRPCILTSDAISEATNPSAYLLELFFKGFWGANQLVLVAPGDDLYAEMTSTDDSLHALCNAVYVTMVPTEAQYTSLQLYSTTFKVRIVYHEESNSAADTNVQSRLGFEQWFAGDINDPNSMAFTTEGASTARIMSADLTTDLTQDGVQILYSRPVRVISTIDSSIGVATRIAEYVDSSGVAITSDGYPSAGMMTWEGVDGLEELHMFASIGWFDTGSWAWVHHMVEWATKGVFMGERRFYLAATVDDLFLKTPEFSYGEGGVDENGDSYHEGTEYRCTGEHLANLKNVQDALNAQYSSSIVTEFAFNGAGILEEVDSPYIPPYEETIVTVKGTKMTAPGMQTLVHSEDYLSVTVPLLEAEHTAGGWDADELLQAVLAYPDDFYHGSHTLIHLSRDELQESDCNIEDGANAQIAVITGMFAMANYNWRSMVSPGITGLFNANCLKSGDNNLMTCYPGDNTYDGVNTDVSLVSTISPYHSIYTTESTNGYDGMQIVPRFATYVYYNCVSASCLVNENEYIRRIVCGCSELDPSLDRGTCSNVGTVNGCNSDDDITSFSDTEDVFDTEAATTTRYLLSGHRDKYMFHQANIVPADDLNGKSTLEYWYEKVLSLLHSYITFPVKSVKFDDLCVNFKEHETLDASGVLVTATVASDGSISGMSLSYSDSAGLIPVTVPTDSVATMSLGSLTPYDTETYGSDTTYYLATTEDVQPTPAPQPDASELAPLTIDAAAEAPPVSADVADELEKESEEAQEINEQVAHEAGFVIDNFRPANTNA